MPRYLGVAVRWAWTVALENTLAVIAKILLLLQETGLVEVLSCMHRASKAGGVEASVYPRKEQRE